MKNFMIITGAYPPQICGVADYVYKLLQTENALEWELYYSDDWSVKTFFKKIKEIKKTNIQNLNIQYPANGYYGSFLPHLIGIYFSLFTKKKMSVTVHELSQMSKKAKLAELILLFFSDKLIFTNEYELKYAQKFLFNIKSKSKVIKIYTNIETNDIIIPIEKREIDIVYFGLIRPEKGIEEFIQMVKKMKEENSNLKIAFVGKTQSQFADYAEFVLSSLSQFLEVQKLNANEKEVSKILSNCKIAYLPFPDGISERRGSALAVLASGVILVTTSGLFSSNEFLNNITIASNITEAEHSIKEILLLSNDKQNLLQRKGVLFLQNYFPKSWEEVANDYIQFLI